MKNMGRNSVEYIFELSEKQAEKYRNEKISEKLFEVEAVEEVNLVGQNEEIAE